MKPSDLKGIFPFSSIDNRAEHESHMMWLIDKLIKTGDTFRELTYEEYKKLGGKDTPEILTHFNKYIKSEDTIRLYSDCFNI